MRYTSTLVWAIILVVASSWAADEATQSPQKADLPNSENTEPVQQDAQDVVLDDTASLREELRLLRLDVLRLQQTVDSLAKGDLAQLRAENERLRKELRELSGMTGQTLPPVPMPDRALLEGLYAEKNARDAKKKTAETPSETPSGAEGSVPAAESPQSSEAPAAPEPFKFEIVEEWGRSPEEMAAGNRQGSSLKGIIGVVPVGSSDADLIGLGRSLHEQYAGFDNVNIEVFDDIEAARSYKGKYVAPPKHRVLSISKHKATDRDVILLIRDEKAVTVPLEPAAAPR